MAYHLTTYLCRSYFIQNTKCVSYFFLHILCFHSIIPNYRLRILLRFCRLFWRHYPVVLSLRLSVCLYVYMIVIFCLVVFLTLSFIFNYFALTVFWSPIFFFLPFSYEKNSPTLSRLCIFKILNSIFLSLLFIVQFHGLNGSGSPAC